MTREEAYQKAIEGCKIKHNEFLAFEYLEIVNDRMVTEEGQFFERQFWSLDRFSDGWFVINELDVSVKVEPHSFIDKSFDINVNDLITLSVDFDDVDHDVVDAMVSTIKEILEINWSKKIFLKYYKTLLTRKWKDKANGDLRSEYENKMCDYINDNIKQYEK